MVNINRVKLQIKIKKFKNGLINSWYGLMKPLAILIDKIEEKRKERFYLKSESMTTDEVAKKLSKLIIKQLIRRSNGDSKYTLEFEIANKTVYDEDGMTVLEYIRGQYQDKALKHWAYKVNNGLEMNKELSDLLVHKYLKQEGVDIKTFKASYYDEYSWRKPKDYQYTLQIKLKNF